MTDDNLVHIHHIGQLLDRERNRAAVWKTFNPWLIQPRDGLLAGEARRGEIVLDNVRTMPAMLERDQGAPISRVELGQIKPRVAIVRGADVRPFFRVIADAAARCTPQGKHIVVPGQKHMWPGEDVAGFTATVADFILGR